jgi:hypothetical protein
LLIALRNAVLGIPIAALLGALVILPGRSAFHRLSRLRGPGWTAILPATILVGTIGPLALPPLARALLVLVAAATPLLALTAALWVVRRLLLATIVAVAAACAVIVHGAWVVQLGQSLMAGLGCLSIGVAVERRIARGWLMAGVVAMVVVDIALLASETGDREAALLGGATTWLPGIGYTRVQLGRDIIGYPDLFLAGLLGTALIGDRRQHLGSRAGVRADLRVRRAARSGRDSPRDGATRAHAPGDGGTACRPFSPTISWHKRSLDQTWRPGHRSTKHEYDAPGGRNPNAACAAYTDKSTIPASTAAIPTWWTTSRRSPSRR